MEEWERFKTFWAQSPSVGFLCAAIRAEEEYRVHTKTLQLKTELKICARQNFSKRFKKGIEETAAPRKPDNFILG